MLSSHPVHQSQVLAKSNNGRGRGSGSGHGQKLTVSYIASKTDDFVVENFKTIEKSD